MNVGLFIPCYVDQFYPQVAIATLELLEKQGLTVTYPRGQTCCGQPMANSGFEHLGQSLNERFIEQFSEVDYVVCPSGSCALHLKEHLSGNAQSDTNAALATQVRSRVYELVEFLTDVLKVDNLTARFPSQGRTVRVGLHQSCHGQRGLHLAQMSELVAAPFSKPMQLLSQVRDLELIELDRPDECCGFGGTFCVTEAAVSAKMGKDRVADHVRHGAEFITGADMSCLMHMEGILRRQNSPTKVIHIAEILNNV